MSSELVHLIKKIGIEAVEEKAPMGVMFGIVTKESPLEVTVEQRLKLGEKHLILTRSVMDYETEISFDNSDIKQKVSNWDIAEEEEGAEYKIAFKEKKKHNVTVYNGLKVDERVILLRVQGGQKFIVLERLVSL